MNRVVLLVRNLSTSPLRCAPQLPVTISGVGGKYAGAIYSAAVKSNNLENVISEMSALQVGLPWVKLCELQLRLFKGELKKNEKIKNILVDPFVRVKEKKSQIEAIASKLKCGNVTKNFLELVATNGRMSSLEEIFGAFGQIVAAHRGEFSCEVTTAKPLDSSSKQSLEKVLQGFGGKGGKNMQINYKTDPSLLAGMTVSIGNQFIDMSTASKIEKYKATIESVL